MPVKETISVFIIGMALSFFLPFWIFGLILVYAVLMALARCFNNLLGASICRKKYRLG